MHVHEFCPVIESFFIFFSKEIAYNSLAIGIHSLELFHTFSTKSVFTICLMISWLESSPVVTFVIGLFVLLIFSRRLFLTVYLLSFFFYLLYIYF